nr:angiopoietin-related protein 7-like isoform X2 [Drosophila suzukii]
MKTSNVNNPAEEPQGSSLESSTESEGEVKNVRDDNFEINKRNLRKIEGLEARLEVSEKEKIRLYEVLIGEKDNLIKLITETKNLTIKQMQSQINDLHYVLNLKNSLNENSAREIPENLDSKDMPHISEERQPIKIQLGTMINQMELHKEYIAELESKVQEKDALIANFESKVEEMKIHLENFKENSKKDEDCLKVKIAELEKKVTITSAELNEKDNQLKRTSLDLNITTESRVRTVVGMKLGLFMAVFEDIPSAGSDWMVIQHSSSFGHQALQNIPQSLSNGFGDLNGDYFLGYNIIHQLTSTQTHEVYVKFETENITRFARYDHFVVGSKDGRYILEFLGSYSGDFGDCLQRHEKKEVPQPWFNTYNHYLNPATVKSFKMFIRPKKATNKSMKFNNALNSICKDVLRP